MAKISHIYGRQILDSRGWPTVECQIWLDTGHTAVSSSPTGTAVGKYEAVDLRDKEPNRMDGMSVLQAVDNVNNVLAPKLIGQNPVDQATIDSIMINADGTPNKKNIGANAMLAISKAVARVGAMAYDMPLYYYLQQQYQLQDQLRIPSCIYTMINGGKHGAGNLDIQEFDLIPASHISFTASLNMAVILYRRLAQVLESKGAIHSVGLVGGFTPNLYNNADAFELMIETIKASPFTFAQDVFFGADFSADNLFNDNKYYLKDKKQTYTPEELVEYYKKLRNIYHVFYLEDPFHDDDWKMWQSTTADLGKTSLIVGDSFLATNPDRLSKAIQQQAANAILIKPSHIGTISETINVIRMAKEAGWTVIISHRSGETNDDFLADLAVGIGAHYVKFGPPQRGERIAKYNRLIEINTELENWYAQQGSESENQAVEAQQSQETPQENAQ